MSYKANDIGEIMEKTYSHAIIKDIYYKIINGDIDIEKSIIYFRANLYDLPCIAFLKKYQEITKKGFLRKIDENEFINYGAIYFSILEICNSILFIANRQRA